MGVSEKFYLRVGNKWHLVRHFPHHALRFRVYEGQILIHTSASQTVRHSRSSKLYKLIRALFSLNPDSILMEGNHKVSVHQRTVQRDQVIVGLFIPVFGVAPQLPEFLPNGVMDFLGGTESRVSLTGKVTTAVGKGVRVMDSEVLVNGPPCTVQSACDPAIDQT